VHLQNKIKSAENAYEKAVQTFYATQSLIQTQERCAKEALLHFGCTLEPPPSLETLWFNNEAEMLKENAEVVKADQEA
jgi:hypothetical protein